MLEYIPFTNRFTHTADFVPSAAEQQLYDEVSAYLQREVLVALPNARRKLITLIMRKLLASSSAAIGATLTKFVERLSGPKQAALPLEDSLAQDFESLDEIEEEWEEDAAVDAPEDTAAQARMELADLQRFVALAKSVERDSKASKLVESLPVAFKLAMEKGAAKKAVIFTESCKTQEYLFGLLTESGYGGEIVLMNGSNNDEVSKRTYAEWKKRHEDRWEDVTSGSKSADMKAAIVEQFRDRGTILLATESAAEGVNLQFCSIVVNYDLPWNPQRIEQRIGRCHRYGQKSDVLVVNFLNRKNEADKRVFELLDQKFNLFKGVFGATFEYEPHASALSQYRGKSGWLEVSKLSTDALGRTEELLLVAACDAEGQPVSPDVASKLFSLRGSTAAAAGGSPPAALATIRTELQARRLADLDTRNEDFFQEEAEKIERRSEDLKVGLEREIKFLDRDITAQQREARKVKGLQEKLDAQKALRSLEGRRDAKRRQYFEEQDRIKADQDNLIQTLERQLKVKAVTVDTVMTLSWRLVDRGANS